MGEVDLKRMMEELKEMNRRLDELVGIDRRKFILNCFPLCRQLEEILRLMDDNERVYFMLGVVFAKIQMAEGRRE